MGSRIVRFVNILIALALLVAAIDSCTIETDVGAGVTVTFDPRGAPHIRASSLEDALFVQGYVTAQDRLFQMDSLRRLAAGDLAEIVGPAALESDRDSRRLRMRRIAEQTYVTLPAADRAAMAAYARGVNGFLATHLNQLPLEFTLLGYQPRPWSVVDSLLLSLYMYRDLTTSWRDQVTLQGLLATGARLERVGSGRQPHGFRQAAALERHAPGIFAAGHLVYDAHRGAGDGCIRRHRSRPSRRAGGT